MPYNIVYAVEADSIEAVSEAIESATNFVRESHDSSYLGVYDLFRIPEDLIIKYNYVNEQNDWDYPAYKGRNILIVMQKTDRPDHISALVARLGIDAVLVEQEEF
jgi:hypothetical protein